MKKLRVALICAGGLALAGAGCAARQSVPVAPQSHAFHAPAVVPFIENDYAKAMQLARARNLPVVVEQWATWCHTCRSMRKFVWSDPALAKHADRFVWLSLNVDLPVNAPTVENLQEPDVPAVVILDSSTGKRLVKWVGTATLEELEGLFAAADAARDPAKHKGLLAQIVKADAVHAEAKPAEAAALYAEILAQAPANLPELSRLIEKYVSSLAASYQAERCAKEALRVGQSMSRDASFVMISGIALNCVLSSPEEAWAGELLDKVEGMVSEALKVAAVNPDDRSSLYLLLHDSRRAAGDLEGLRAVAAQWLTFLEAESAKSSDAVHRAALNQTLVVAAIALGKPERALPAVEAARRELPADLMSTLLLGKLQRAMGDFDAAMKLAEEGISRTAGSNRIELLELKGNLLEDKGVTADAQRVYREALSYNESLPKRMRHPNAEARMRLALDSIQASSSF